MSAGSRFMGNPPPRGSIGRVPRRQQHPAAKHADNHPIVTVIGAGIAGLSAAHELMERGFLVQVIEREKSQVRRGNVQVGGLASTQYARADAPIEELHSDLLDFVAGATTPEEDRRFVEAFLELFSFSRSLLSCSMQPIELDLWVEFKTNQHTTAGIATMTDGFEQPALPGPYVDRLMKGLIARRARLLHNLSQDRAGHLATLQQSIGELCGDGPSFVPLITWPRTLLSRDQVQQLGALQGDTRFDDALYRELAKNIRAADSEAYARWRPSATLVELLTKALRREILWVEIVGFRLVGENATDIEEKRAGTVMRELLRDAGQPGRLIEPHLIPGSALRIDPHHRGKGHVVLRVVERQLPGEHGFRFFPRHYENLYEMMRRVPEVDVHGHLNTLHTLFDNLKPTGEQALGLPCKGRVPLLRRRARSLDEIHRAAKSFFEKTDVTARDTRWFQFAMLKFMLSGRKRRWGEYNDVSWRDFIGFDVPGRFTEAMKAQIGAAAQSLLAYSVAEADAHSYGNFSTQTLVDQFSDGTNVDMILRGPTSEAWLEPWKSWLKQQGVCFFLGEWTGFAFATDEDGNETREVVPKFATTPIPEPGCPHPYFDGDVIHGKPGMAPDHYVLAVPLQALKQPLEDLERMLEAERKREKQRTVRRLDGDFARALAFARKADDKDQDFNRWMSGIQFFFDSRVSLGPAHAYYPRSTWGLSTIAQTDHWIRERDERLQGIVSVDIADWYARNEYAKKGEEAVGKSVLEIACETVLQINESSIERPTSYRADEYPKSDASGALPLPIPDYVHLDLGVDLSSTQQAERPRTFYLANLTSQFRDRPGLQWTRHGDDPPQPPSIEYQVFRDRWVLAGAFMATHTRMMTMEGSNESGRHAVRAIVKARNDATPGSPRDGRFNGIQRHQQLMPPVVFDIEDMELEDLRWARDLDDALYDAGLPHVFDILEGELQMEIVDDMISATEAAVRMRTRLSELGRRVEVADIRELVEARAVKLAEDWGFLFAGGELPNMVSAAVSDLDFAGRLLKDALRDRDRSTGGDDG